jgi:NAD(P)-dependent dehydrogenase (short-subunit alcohol dehydrogenase family)
MIVKDKNVLITGTARGIGTALVREALERGARKVYAAARSAAASSQWRDPRVVPLVVDITDEKMVAAAARDATDTDLLINNAGVLTRGTVLALTDVEMRRDMDTNFYGTLRVIRAFAQSLVRRPQAAIVNVLSIVSFAGMPPFDSYSASKAALHSATQSLRAELAAQKIAVHGVFPGPVDTAMAEGVPIPKASTESVATMIFDGIEADVDDIFPDEVSQTIGAQWLDDPKGVEVRFASMGM